MGEFFSFFPFRSPFFSSAHKVDVNVDVQAEEEC